MSAIISVPDTSTLSTLNPNEAAYVYSGGWSDSNTALDAGIFYAKDANGNDKNGPDFAPFFKIELPANSTLPSFVNPKWVDPQGAAHSLHLKGGQGFSFQFYTTDTEFVMVIGPKDASSKLVWVDYNTSPATTLPADNVTRTFRYPIPSGVTGWSSTGKGQIVKAMTSIAQTIPFTNPSGTTNFSGVQWATMKYGKRNAQGVITSNTWNVTTQGSCSYPSSGVITATTTGTAKDGETVAIKFVGSAGIQFSKTSFSYSGKAGDKFNVTGVDKVVIKNTGAAGSMLYWCKQTPAGSCLIKTDSNGNRTTPNPPILGGASASVVVSDPAGNPPECALDAQLQKDASFIIEYATNPPTSTPQTITVKLTCSGQTNVPVRAAVSPTSIVLNGVVGGGAVSAPFTVSNIGDVGSVLDYRVYRIASGNVAAGVTSKAVQQPAGSIKPQALPGPTEPTYDTWQNSGLSPKTTVADSITKQATGSNSKSYTVSATCTNYETGHDSVVNIEYATGNTVNGQPEVKTVPVSVHITCSGHETRFSPNTLTLTTDPGKSIDFTGNFTAYGVAVGAYPTVYDYTDITIDNTATWLSATSNTTGNVPLNGSIPIGFHAVCPNEVTTFETDVFVGTGDLGELTPITEPKLHVKLVCKGARMEIPVNTTFLYYSNAPLEGSFEVRNVGTEALTYQLNYTSNYAPWLTILSGSSGTVQPNAAATVRYRFQCGLTGKDAYGAYDSLTITSNDAVAPSASIASNSFCKQPNLQAMQLAGNFCPRDVNGNLACPTTGRQNIRQTDPSDLQQAYVQVMAISLETGASPNLVSLTPPSGWQFLSSRDATNGKALVYWKWADYFSATPSAYREWVVNDGRTAPLKGQWAAFWTSAVYGYQILGEGLADYQIGSVDTSTRRGVSNPTSPVLEVLDPATQPPALPRPVLLASVGAGSSASCSFPTLFCQLQDFYLVSKVATLAYSGAGQADRTVTSLVTAAAPTANYYVVGSVDQFPHNVFAYQRPQRASALRVASSANRPILGQPSAFPTPRFPPAP
jgi:hypothetical protein